VIGAALDRPRKLGKCNDGNVELSGKTLETARDLRNLLHSVLRAPRIHQLEVVDDQQVEPMFGLQATGFAPHFHDVETSGIIYVDLGLR
jgi:hypothetical protein